MMRASQNRWGWPFSQSWCVLNSSSNHFFCNCKLPEACVRSLGRANSRGRGVPSPFYHSFFLACQGVVYRHYNNESPLIASLPPHINFANKQLLSPITPSTHLLSPLLPTDPGKCLNVPSIEDTDPFLQSRSHNHPTAIPT